MRWLPARVWLLHAKHQHTPPSLSLPTTSKVFSKVTQLLGGLRSPGLIQKDMQISIQMRGQQPGANTDQHWRHPPTLCSSPRTAGLGTAGNVCPTLTQQENRTEHGCFCQASSE